jgi:cyclopropane fatty-acyl-phospholipid synthase-like methyltransferase
MTVMEPRLQRRVQRYGWDRAVAAYEQGWRAQLAPAHSLMLSVADLRPGERVLDVACGTGIVVRIIARRLDGALIVRSATGVLQARKPS